MTASTKISKGPILQTQTPDQMLDGAVRRMFAIGEKIIKHNARPIFVPGKKYYYSFDPTAIYAFVSYDGAFYRTFKRESDGALARATRFSLPPEPIE